MRSITKYLNENINKNIKADAVVVSKKGDYKYIFIKGNQPNNLKPDPRGRVKNKFYKKKNRKIYPVIVDMYEHPHIKSRDGDLADIWVVDNLEQAQKQLDLMIKHGAKQFERKIRINNY